MKKTPAKTAGPRDYYRLAKPGIVYGNLFTSAGGFFLASQGHVRFGLLLATLLGIGLIMASACVINNYIDREIDKKMTRTQNRALVTGIISARNAFIYAAILGMLGFGLLLIATNLLTFCLGIIALFTYVVLYGIAKRRSVHGTLVGSIAGSLPPVAGYTAVTNHFDSAALLLFLILTTWQMPHFYAIATYRKKEYAAAGLPVLTVKRGVLAAKIQITGYILAFIAAAMLLTGTGYTGYSYLVVMLVMSGLWLKIALQGFRATNNNVWARKVFGHSLLVLLSFSIMISIDHFLP